MLSQATLSAVTFSPGRGRYRQSDATSKPHGLSESDKVQSKGEGKMHRAREQQSRR